jgi:hypothetical protein
MRAYSYIKQWFTPPIKVVDAAMTDGEAIPPRPKMIDPDDPILARLSTMKQLRSDLFVTVDKMHANITKLVVRDTILEDTIAETDALVLQSRNLFHKSLPWHKRLRERLLVCLSDFKHRLLACCCCRTWKRLKTVFKKEKEVPEIELTEQTQSTTIDSLRWRAEHGSDIWRDYQWELDI